MTERSQNAVTATLGFVRTNRRRAPDRAVQLVRASVSSVTRQLEVGCVNDSVPPDERPVLLDGAEAAVTFATGTGANDVPWQEGTRRRETVQAGGGRIGLRSKQHPA